MEAAVQRRPLALKSREHEARGAHRGLNLSPMRRSLSANRWAARTASNMALRSFLIWCTLVLVAVINGAVRNASVTPRLGEQAGHVISTIIFCTAILLVTWLAIGWIGPTSPRAALLIGGGWVLLTVAFEFLAGHYVFGNPWNTLLADYNLFRGRVWLLVLVTSALAPLVAAHARGLLGLRE